MSVFSSLSLFICLCFINSPTFGTGTVSFVGLVAVNCGTYTVSILIPVDEVMCTESDTDKRAVVCTEFETGEPAILSFILFYIYIYIAFS